MRSILLGHDQNTGKPIHVPVDAFSTHVHVPGATGTGKSTAVLTLLYQLLLDAHQPACHFVVDFLGGLTRDLLRWMASRYCPPWVRERLVLVEPSREDVALPMNPLLYDTLDHGYYKVSRATELILRAWESQNVGEMPRLARWLFNSFWACAQLGLTIADTVHLLLPGSGYHRPLLDALPERLRLEWQEIHGAHGGEATKILDSSRNRMKPFYESGILRNLFGSAHNRFDAPRFMREARVVVLNLAPANRVSPQMATAIAGLAVNEVLATARSLPRHVRYPTYLWLDEFQRMVTPDVEFAIPEVRQLGIRLILAHQSFSQLVRGDCDLTSIIWQPQTRLVFGEQGEDANILAEELAALTYDPKRIKDEIYRLQQLQTGHKMVELSAWGTSRADAENWAKQYSQGWSAQNGRARREDVHGQDVLSGASGKSGSEGGSAGGARTVANTHSTHQQLIAEMKTIEVLANRTYYTFEEQRAIWGREVRQLRTGSCLLRAVNDPTLYPVRVKQTKPGHLAFDEDVVRRRLPEEHEAVERLVEDNFRQEFFVTPAEIERETRERLEQALRPPIRVIAAPAEDDVFN